MSTPMWSSWQHGLLLEHRADCAQHPLSAANVINDVGLRSRAISSAGPLSVYQLYVDFDSAANLPAVTGSRLHAGSIQRDPLPAAPSSRRASASMRLGS